MLCYRLSIRLSFLIFTICSLENYFLFATFNINDDVDRSLLTEANVEQSIKGGVKIVSRALLFDRAQLPKLPDTDTIELYHLRSFPLFIGKHWAHRIFVFLPIWLTAHSSRYCSWEVFNSILRVGTAEYDHR